MPQLFGRPADNHPFSHTADYYLLKGGFWGRRTRNMPQLSGRPADNYTFNHISDNYQFNRPSDNYPFNRLTGQNTFKQC